VLGFRLFSDTSGTPEGPWYDFSLPGTTTAAAAEETTIAEPEIEGNLFITQQNIVGTCCCL